MLLLFIVRFTWRNEVTPPTWDYFVHLWVFQSVSLSVRYKWGNRVKECFTLWDSFTNAKGNITYEVQGQNSILGEIYYFSCIMYHSFPRRMFIRLLCLGNQDGILGILVQCNPSLDHRCASFFFKHELARGTQHNRRSIFPYCDEAFVLRNPSCDTKSKERWWWRWQIHWWRVICWWNEAVKHDCSLWDVHSENVL